MLKKYFNIAKNQLFSINRSLTGKGVVKTLNIIQKEFSKLKIKSIKSRSKVFDWTVPQEWNVKNAYVVDKNNVKIIDIEKNNLHLIGYSIPLKKTLTKKDLFKNLYFLKNQPTAIPYITSYYQKRWGFCISYNQYKQFKKKYSSKDKFKVVINSTLKNNGKLNYGELVLKGKCQKRKQTLDNGYIYREVKLI